MTEQCTRAHQCAVDGPCNGFPRGTQHVPGNLAPHPGETPVEHFHRCERDKALFADFQPSLLDQFAMSAHSGLLASLSRDEIAKVVIMQSEAANVPLFDYIANKAYEHARAMMRART